MSSGLLVRRTPHKTMSALFSGLTAGFFLPQICPELFESMENFGFPNMPSQGAPQLETEGKVILNSSRSCWLKQQHIMYFIQNILPLKVTFDFQIFNTVNNGSVWTQLFEFNWHIYLQP